MKIVKEGLSFKEAIKALQEGAKVAHSFFDKGQYLYTKETMIMIRRYNRIDKKYSPTIFEILDNDWLILEY